MKLPPNATDEQVEDFNRKQLFVRDALPVEWLEYAEELRDAAEALWADSVNAMEVEMTTQVGGTMLIQKRIGHCRSYILLAGLALENAIKATLIVLDPTLINTGALEKSLHTHELIALADRIPGITLNEEELQVLRVCQDAIPYWGRYPIPLRYADLLPKEAASPEFRDAFERLHFRLCREVYVSIRDGWDSGVGPATDSVRSQRYGDEIDADEPFPWAERPGG